VTLRGLEGQSFAMSLLGLLGPVFDYEWLRMSRRWQMYALRSAFVALLAAGLTAVWSRYVRGSTPDIRSLAATGEFFFYALIGTQLFVILLAAPAATAGAMALEKARGEILQLLATDLSSAEIVFGKLTARLVPVVGLLLCSLPVLFAAVLLGGIAPDALLGAYGVTLGIAVLGCTLALLLSLWGTTTHEVLLTNYFLWTFTLLLPWMWGVGQMEGLLPAPPAWLTDLNPFPMVFLPYLRPGSPCLEDQVVYLGGCLGLSLVLMVLAVLSLRRVTIRRSGVSARPRAFPKYISWSLLPSPSLDANPVIWRECRYRRPSIGTRIVWLAYALLASLFTMVAVCERLSTTTRFLLPRLVNGFQVAAGLLLVSIAAATVLTEVQNPGALEVLLATPLSTRSIIWGKWWGTFRTVPVLSVLPLLVASAGALQTGQWLPVVLLFAMILGFGAALASFGLALATRLQRVGSALAWCVGTYVFITVVWVPLMMVLFRGHDEVICSGSPFIAAAILTACGEEIPRQGDYGRALCWNLIWLAVYVMTALFLLRWTVRNFNRYCGRMDDRSRKRLSLNAKGSHRTFSQETVNGERKTGGIRL
jgi:ABC-type transport system involved in multi-copper enzyme maturation permease subunit